MNLFDTVSKPRAINGIVTSVHVRRYEESNQRWQIFDATTIIKIKMIIKIRWNIADRYVTRHQRLALTMLSTNSFSFEHFALPKWRNEMCGQFDCVIPFIPFRGLPRLGIDGTCDSIRLASCLNVFGISKHAVSDTVSINNRVCSTLYKRTIFFARWVTCV